MHYVRFHPQLALLLNDDALIAGGGTGDAGCTTEIFSNGQWTLTADMAQCCATETFAALLPNGDVLIDAGSASQFYDPSTNVWEPTSNQPNVLGPLALLTTGDVLVVGSAS
ncbi:MAG TPA: hypothetical protein VI455_08675 [Terriglobia bacterium]